jgi:glycosyltransferase involved in cell wall biosynthesis
MKKIKLISIVTPAFNEEDNIMELCDRVKAVMLSVSFEFDYEHIIIDNASNDRTLEYAKKLAASDRKIKIIVNNRNYGPVRSPYYGILSASGDAVVMIASDLQDPPELIIKYLEKWKHGYEVVLPSKPQSIESIWMKQTRKLYYKLINSISDVPLENNATGSGLFDKKVVDILRTISDPYPYFRGLICDLGFKRCTIDFIQPKRAKGVSKATLYGMFDQAFLAMTKHSKLPLRVMTFLGIILGLLTLMISFIFLTMKILYWDSFSMGVAPILIGGFFIASMLFFFLGIIGEYVGMILTHVRQMPLVIERERVNFEIEDKNQD